MASQEPVTKADLQDVVLQIQQSTKAQIEQSEQRMKPQIESVVLLVQRVAERVDHRFEELEGWLERRFDGMESRLDRMNDALNYVVNQMGAFNRWADRVDRGYSSQLGTQEAQQKAIDSLNERVTRLERRNQN
jgi:hypothetical protein